MICIRDDLNKENIEYFTRTDGQFICVDCIYLRGYNWNSKCLLNKHTTSITPFTCSSYKSINME